MGGFSEAITKWALSIVSTAGVDHTILRTWTHLDEFCNKLPNFACIQCCRTLVFVKTKRRLGILWKSHGYNIPATSFGFIEALVRGLEQFTEG